MEKWYCEHPVYVRSYWGGQGQGFEIRFMDADGKVASERFRSDSVDFDAVKGEATNLLANVYGIMQPLWIER